MNRDEVIWAAGFFDGEGSTTGYHPGSKKYFAMRLSIGQCDREILERFQNAVGAGRIGKVERPDLAPSGNPNRRPIHRWRTTAHQETIRVLAILWPHLGTAKRIQACRIRMKYAHHPHRGIES